MAQVRTAVEAKYEPRIDKARQDPGLQQRIRDEMARELDAVKKSYTKFEGQKTGWDVSIIGPEFQQNTSEAVLVTKEDIWTRYFFFFEDGLYKMFLGFNKDAIGGKNFQEFGKGMESKYGNAREVYRDDKTARRRHPQARSLRVVGGRRRSAEADRSLRVLRRLLPRAVRRIGPGPRRRAAQGRQPRRRQAKTSWSKSVTGKDEGRRARTSTTTSSTASSAKRSRSRARTRARARTSSSTRRTSPRPRPRRRARDRARRRRR